MREAITKIRVFLGVREIIKKAFIEQKGLKEVCPTTMAKGSTAVVRSRIVLKGGWYRGPAQSRFERDGENRTAPFARIGAGLV